MKSREFPLCFSQFSVWQSNPFELAQLDDIVSQSIDMRYQFHLLTFEVSYAHFAFSWILSWLTPIVYNCERIFFAFYFARTTNEMPKPGETKKRKTKNQKNQKINRNQNEIQPEANVNKVQSDVCFCQKRKRGESKNTEYFDLCSPVPLSLCPMSLATPCPTHSRVLSVACPA